MLLNLIRKAVDDAVTLDAGAVLSGGIDSSTIACVARRQGHELPTFTGYYNVPGFDERPYARLAAGKYHHEILITPDDIIEHFDGMMRAFRPPFQGPGAMGQYMVARYASQRVGVVLSGEGGDELFGGYARLLIVAGHRPPDGYENYQLPVNYPRTVAAALQYDWERLPDLLAVDDQACSAWGLEARAPFTDQRIVDHVLARPAKERVGKIMLKQAVRGIVPDQILWRTDKMGMPAPFVQWAQGPLRDFFLDRIGYLPDPARPWDRQWWYDLVEPQRVAA